MGNVSSYESHLARLEQAASPSRPLAPPTVFDGAEHDSALRMGKFSFHSAQIGPLGELPAGGERRRTAAGGESCASLLLHFQPLQHFIAGTYGLTTPTGACTRLWEGPQCMLC